MLLDIKNPIVDWFFPRRCIVCAVDLLEENLCKSCASLVTRHPFGIGFNDDNIMSLFYFEFTVNKLIKDAKFYNNSLSLYLLSEIIKKELISSEIINDIKKFNPDAISYIPSHFVYRLRRGIELPFWFAFFLGKSFNIPVVPLLTRTGFYHRQALAKNKVERRVHIQNAFKVKISNLKIKRLLLVDDILTTGATLDEAMKTLRGQAKSIKCIVIAKTP